jgi:leader peptidase (prepilin peptidase) / N-methyltransferase
VQEAAEVVAGVIAGVVSGAATPFIARHFGAAANGWLCAGLGAPVGAALGWRLEVDVLKVWLLVLVVGIPLVVIDLAVHRLPDLIVLPAILSAALQGQSWRALAGGAVLVTVYAVLAVLPRGGLGFGDVKLAGLLGIALALLGWAPLVWGTALAFALGGVVALALLAMKKARRDTQLPFGPAMLAGAVLTALLV